MPKIDDIKAGDKLFDYRSCGSPLIRQVVNIVSGVLTFQDGGVVLLRDIEDGNWSKLEPIRGSKSYPRIGDTVQFRDSREVVTNDNGVEISFASGRKVPKNEIHYDTDANEFWFLCPRLDVRVGDIVIQGTTRWKIEKLDYAHRKIIFEGGERFMEWTDLVLDTESRSWYISELDRIEAKAIPTLKSGDTVTHRDRQYTVKEVKGVTVYFSKGGELPISKLCYKDVRWIISSTVAFWDMEVPNSVYWLIAGKTEEEITEKIRYATTKGFKLWGPTQVKGDYYAQALRK